MTAPVLIPLRNQVEYEDEIRAALEMGLLGGGGL
jgi:hypothetical protein